MQEVAHLGRIVVGSERAVEVERRSVAGAESDASRCMNDAAVERGAQHEPPVEQVAEAAARNVELSRAEHRHRRRLIGDEIGERLGGQPPRDAAVGTRAGHDLPAVAMPEHGGPDVGRRDRERPQAQPRGARAMPARFASNASGSVSRKNRSGSSAGAAPSSRVRTSTLMIASAVRAAPGARRRGPRRSSRSRPRARSPR